ncbi:MAG: hypothetical protein H0X31_04090, partial [Nostocaceae cyanobacterium]|nr:hypothetical protein [Nostocaceae cyanobacterium]
MAQAHAASFTFTKIADTQSDFTSLENGIALNDSGVVSFVGTKPTTSGVFTGNGTAIATIIDATNLPSLFPPGLPPGPPNFFLGYSPNSYSLGKTTAINNQGSVLFTATNSSSLTPRQSLSEQGLFKSRNGSISKVAALSSDSIFSSFQTSQNYTSFDLNDSERIVSSISQLDYTPRLYEHTIIAIDGRNIAIGISGANAPQRYVYAPTINHQGTVYYAASGTGTDVANQLVVNNLHVVNNGVDTPIFDPSVQVTTLAANNSGSVFSGRLNNNVFGKGLSEPGIFQVENGVAKRIFDGTADFIDINNQGTVAFGSTKQISLLSNGVSEQIIGIGDSLLGSTVQTVFFPSSKSLNNAGQVAFYAHLADGTKGIFRADPISTKVPEPTAILGLVAFASLGISSRRRDRRS